MAIIKNILYGIIFMLGSGGSLPICQAEVSGENGIVAGTWVTARSGQIPPHSFKAGIIDGADVYICRHSYLGGLYPGRIVNGSKHCVFMWNNDVETGTDIYEVLQDAPFLQWERTGLGWAGSNTLKAGLADGDHANYICKFYIDNVLKVGRAFTGSRWCYAPGVSMQYLKAYRYDVLKVQNP